MAEFLFFFLGYLVARLGAAWPRWREHRAFKRAMRRYR